MKADAFKPQGSMRPATLVSMGAPPGPTRMSPLGPQQHGSPLPLDPNSRGAAISSNKEVPRNATQVRIAGPMSSPLMGAPQGGASAAEPRKAAFQPQSGQLVLSGVPVPSASAPRAETVYRVSLRGRSPDGAEWVANYDAVFPGSGVQVGAAEVQPLT